MKYRSVLLILLIVFCRSQTVRPQTDDSWVNVTPPGEQFPIRMPKGYVVHPASLSFDKFRGDGKVYTVTSGGVDYTVWSFLDEGSPDSGSDLDACADLVWESLLKPLRDQLPKEPEVAAHMSYQRALVSNSLPSGREYSITLGDKLGITHFYVATPRILILVAINANADFAGTQRFLNSFGPREPTLPQAVGVGTGGGVGPGLSGSVSSDSKVGGANRTTGTADSADRERTFNGREVTQRARVIFKPEPQYTESARKYSVQGTVVLRAIFSSSGQVTNLRVVSGLPHGLTARALEAAKLIRFTPATKDGHDASMYIQLEYNFNLY